MIDDQVPPNNSIARYCSGRSITENGRITGAAFMLRPGETYLSVNCLEFLNKKSREEELEELRSILSSKLSLGSTAKLAVLGVGDVQEHVREETFDDRILRILHRPNEPEGIIDPSHCGIFDFSDEEFLIADLIAEMIEESYSAKRSKRERR